MSTKDTTNRPDITTAIRQKTYIKLREQGLTIRESLPLAGYSEKSISYAGSKLEKKRKEIFSDNHARKAKKIVMGVLAGKSPGDAAQAKTSDVLAAAGMVLDRTHPIHDMHSNNISIDISSDAATVLLQALKADFAREMSPIDITPVNSLPPQDIDITPDNDSP